MRVAMLVCACVCVPLLELICLRDSLLWWILLIFCVSSGDYNNNHALWETITWSSFGWHLGGFHLSFKNTLFVLFPLLSSSWLILQILQHSICRNSHNFLIFVTCSVLVQCWCSYMTVPLNVIVSQVGITLSMLSYF